LVVAHHLATDVYLGRYVVGCRGAVAHAQGARRQLSLVAGVPDRHPLQNNLEVFLDKLKKGKKERKIFLMLERRDLTS
jgi:hypothetical protein